MHYASCDNIMDFDNDRYYYNATLHLILSATDARQHSDSEGKCSCPSQCPVYKQHEQSW